jgi:hypothetical protein
MAFLAAAWFAAMPVTTAQAKTCAPAAVTARGEPARYLWMAKLKARANWRRKVRAMSGFGPAYANWQSAENATERCVRSERATFCVFTGIPCRA